MREINNSYIKILNKELLGDINDPYIIANPPDTCFRLGLHVGGEFQFTTFKHLSKVLLDGEYIAFVTIPDNGLVYDRLNYQIYGVDGEVINIDRSHEWTTDKIIIDRVLPIEDLEYWNDREFCLALIKQESYALIYVPDHIQTAEICLIAVRKNDLMLKYVREDLRTANLCTDAVRDNYRALDYVPQIFKNYVKSHC
jgi:hypothetical protein